MSLYLMIQSDPYFKGPELFPTTDGKLFLRTLFGPDVRLFEGKLRIKLTPLYHCAYLADVIPEEVEEVEEMNEEAWHTPEAFIDCLEKLISKLEVTAKMIPWTLHLKLLESRPSYRDYYRSEDFYNDARSCLEAMRFYKEQGATRVRFCAF